MTIGDLLTGERVRLATLTRDDLPLMVPWYRDVVFARLLDSRPAAQPTLETLTRLYDEESKSPTTFLFGIRLLEGDALIGLLELDGIEWSNGTCWLGIGIGQREHRGRGYGPEAVTLALDFAFRELNLHRITVSVFGYNEASRRMFEGLGFTLEGRLREHLHRDGSRHEMLLFGILRPEWEGR
ncbi:MAG: GNAT family protein [Anaerolineae bacterium]